MTDTATPPAAPAGPDPAALLRSRAYMGALVFGAGLGVPVAAVAFFFLKVVAEAQQFLFTTCPGTSASTASRRWWPIPVLAVGGLLVALTIRELPGIGGHRPAEGFKPGATHPFELPGVALAAFVTLAFGAVLGPEAPLIAIGSGLGAWRSTWSSATPPPRPSPSSASPAASPRSARCSARRSWARSC